MVAGGTQRAAPAAGGGRVRDPWSTFKAAKESTLAFANFASQAFADLEGDMSVSFSTLRHIHSLPPRALRWQVEYIDCRLSGFFHDMLYVFVLACRASCPPTLSLSLINFR